MARGLSAMFTALLPKNSKIFDVAKTALLDASQRMMFPLFSGKFASVTHSKPETQPRFDRSSDSVQRRRRRHDDMQGAFDMVRWQVKRAPQGTMVDLRTSMDEVEAKLGAPGG